MLKTNILSLFGKIYLWIADKMTIDVSFRLINIQTLTVTKPECLALELAHRRHYTVSQLCTMYVVKSSRMSLQCLISQRLLSHSL